jgi:hypothetical protein
MSEQAIAIGHLARLSDLLELQAASPRAFSDLMEASGR